MNKIKLEVSWDFNKIKLTFYLLLHQIKSKKKGSASKVKTEIEGEVFVSVIDVIWVSNTGGIVGLFAPNPSVANGIENELYCNLHMVNIHNIRIYPPLHNCSLKGLVSAKLSLVLSPQCLKKMLDIEVLLNFCSDFQMCQTCISNMEGNECRNAE